MVKVDVWKVLHTAFAVALCWWSTLLFLGKSSCLALARKVWSRQGIPIAVFVIAAGVFFLTAHKSVDTVLKYNAYLLNADSIQRFSSWLAYDEKFVLPVTMIDIDDQTYKEWGKPLATPRSFLKMLIQKAVTGQARFIVVDIDLSLDSQVPGDDHELVTYFNTYDTRIPIILVKRIDRTEHGEKFVRSSLDDIVAGNPQIYWALARVVPEPDGIVRRFYTQYTWKENGLECSVTAIPILVNALNREKQLTKSPQCIAPMNETGSVSGDHSIYYRFSGSPDITDMRKLTAQEVLTDPVSAADFFRERVVIIGGSYAEGREIYATPLGWMPGAMIIANTITTSYLLTDSPQGTSWLSMLLSLTMCAVVLVLSSFLRPFPVVIIVFVATIVTVLFSIRFLHYPQILTSIANMIVLVSVVQGTRALLELIWDVRQYGWSAVLKKPVQN